MEKIKVFQIGFNKCGTMSLCDFFIKNGHKSVHWGDGIWDNHFKKNQSVGNLLCEGHNDIVFWSDIGFIQRQFQIFSEQYPNSKFIYNTRPLEKWLDSRNRQYKKHPLAFADNFGFTIENGIDRIDYWKSEWFYRKKVVEEFFIGDMAKRLLIFDIETNTGDDIKKFLPELEFTNLKIPYKNKG